MIFTIYKHIRYRLLPWLFTPYYYLFVLLFWQPIIWNKLNQTMAKIANILKHGENTIRNCIKKYSLRDKVGS